MLQQVFHLDYDVVSHIGKFAMQRFNDPSRVSRTIEEIRIAERDVAGTLFDLRTHIGEDRFYGHDPELAVVDRHDRAMPAAVLAASGRVRRANGLAGTV